MRIASDILFDKLGYPGGVDEQRLFLVPTLLKRDRFFDDYLMLVIIFMKDEHRQDRGLGAVGKNDGPGRRGGFASEEIDVHPAVTAEILVDGDKKYFVVAQHFQRLSYGMPGRFGVNGLQANLTSFSLQVFFHFGIARRTDDAAHLILSVGEGEHHQRKITEMGRDRNDATTFLQRF